MRPPWQPLSRSRSQSTSICSLSDVSAPVASALAPSTAPVVEKAQQEPHSSWFLTWGREVWRAAVRGAAAQPHRRQPLPTSPTTPPPLPRPHLCHRARGQPVHLLGRHGGLVGEGRGAAPAQQRAALRPQLRRIAQRALPVLLLRQVRPRAHRQLQAG